MTVVILALPLVVAAFTVLGKRYVPMGDEAAILFRIREVGGADTPLVGVYSTHGWAHPGPILYYLFSLPFRLSGGSAVAPFAFAAILDLCGVLLICYLAWRRRGLLGVAVFGGMSALVLHGIGPDTLVRIWNPYVPLLPYLAFLLSLWCVAERDDSVMPVAAAMGSAIVQMHVGYLPLAVGGVASAAILRRRQQKTGPDPAARRTASRATVVVLALFWLPPTIDLIFGSRNILRVVNYFIASPSRVAGPRTGFSILSGQVSIIGPWARGHQAAVFSPDHPNFPWQLLTLAVLLLLLAYTHLRKETSRAALPALALGQLAVGGLAASRVEIPINSYLVVWMLPLAAFCWAATALSGVDLALSSLPAEMRLLRPACIALATMLTVVVTRTTTATAALTSLPQQQYAPAVTALMTQLRPALIRGDSIRAEVLGSNFGRAGVGMLYGISKLDPTFYTSDGASGQKWGLTHRWRGQRVAYTLTVAVDDHGSSDGRARACFADRGQQQVAIWSSLPAAEQREVQALRTAQYFSDGPASLKSARRLAALAAKSFTLAVFRGPKVCGT